MSEIVLNANKRDVIGKKVKLLRNEGKLPAVIYGYNLDATPIVLDARDASKILSTVSSSTLINMNIDGKKHAVLVRERQRDILRGNLIHVDFQAVSLTETVRAKVRVSVEGESPAISEFGALIVTGLEELEIECLPNDLLEQIVVDISSLDRVGDAIFVKDIDFPEGITSLDDPETMVAVVTMPAAEPVEEEVEEELEDEYGLPAEPEVIERGEPGEEEEGEEE
ncbi:MAG: 50S ribosomal protein L25 [Anaerolineales bacterium]|jgi:large subunit ribosomal protein L25